MYYQFIQESLDFRSLKIKEEIGKWQSLDDEKTAISIHTKEDGKFYFNKEYSDNSYGIQEIIKESQTLYRFVNDVNNYHLEIDQFGNLLLLTNDKHIIETYKKL